MWCGTLENSNPNEDNHYIFDVFHLQVVTAPTEFLGGLTGVNSFGFGGTNAHVIMNSVNRGMSVCVTGVNSFGLDALMRTCS